MTKCWQIETLDEKWARKRGQKNTVHLYTKKRVRLTLVHTIWTLIYYLFCSTGCPKRLQTTFSTILRPMFLSPYSRFILLIFVHPIGYEAYWICQGFIFPVPHILPPTNTQPHTFNRDFQNMIQNSQKCMLSNKIIAVLLIWEKNRKIARSLVFIRKDFVSRFFVVNGIIYNLPIHIKNFVRNKFIFNCSFLMRKCQGMKRSYYWLKWIHVKSTFHVQFTA